MRQLHTAPCVIRYVRLLRYGESRNKTAGAGASSAPRLGQHRRAPQVRAEKAGHMAGRDRPFGGGTRGPRWAAARSVGPSSQQSLPFRPFPRLRDLQWGRAKSSRLIATSPRPESHACGLKSEGVKSKPERHGEAIGGEDGRGSSGAGSWEVGRRAGRGREFGTLSFTGQSEQLTDWRGGGTECTVHIVRSLARAGPGSSAKASNKSWDSCSFVRPPSWRGGENWQVHAWGG